MLKKVNALFKLNMLVKNVCIKLECISQVATLLLFYFFMQFFWHFQALSSLADCVPILSHHFARILVLLLTLVSGDNNHR